MTEYNTTYGELIVSEDMIKQIGNISNMTFIDLGSGNGRPVIDMAFLYPNLKQSIGVELLKDRYNIAMKTLNELHQQELFDHAPISFYNQDIFKFNLSIFKNPLLIFISNLCFSDSVNNRLSKKFKRELIQHSGTIIICSKPLPNFNYIKTINNVNMTWNKRHQLYMYKLK
jgi:hypothetical protein